MLGFIQIENKVEACQAQQQIVIIFSILFRRLISLCIDSNYDGKSGHLASSDNCITPSAVFTYRLSLSFDIDTWWCSMAYIFIEQRCNFSSIFYYPYIIHLLFFVS